MPFARTLKIVENLLVIGAVYHRLEELTHFLNSLSKTYEVIILLGNITFPFEQIESRIAQIQNLSQKYNFHYLLGDLDFQASQIISHPWFQTNPNIIIAEFQKQGKLILTNGGILNSWNLENLEFNLESSFISQIEGNPWHSIYSGKLGYVISNNPLTNQEPKFYRYSCQIGNNYASKCSTYAVEMNAFGIQEVLSF